LVKIAIEFVHKNENNMRDSEKLVSSNVCFKSSILKDGLCHLGLVEKLGQEDSTRDGKPRDQLKAPKFGFTSWKGQ